MNAEFFSAIADIEKEKGIPQSYMLEKIEQALLAALKKDAPDAADCARVTLDAEKQTVEMYLEKAVVEIGGAGKPAHAVHAGAGARNLAEGGRRRRDPRAR